VNWKTSILRTFGSVLGGMHRAKNFALKNTLEPFPLRQKLAGYNAATAKADLRAGFNVAMLAFCQGMAFAAMAGLPLVYGVMCATVAAIVGPLLASSRHTVLGPTNGSAFLIYSYFAANPHADQLGQMPMLVFLTGALLILGAYLRVADLAQYISRTVVVAYVTGAAVMIVMNQSLTLLSMQPSMEASDKVQLGAGTFPGSLALILTHLSSIKPWPLVVGLITGGCYFSLRKWRPSWPAFLISLMAGTLVAEVLHRFHIMIPTFSDATFGWFNLLPPFPLFVSAEAPGQFSQLFGLAVAVAFVSNLENGIMAKTLASRGNYRVDANQDMLSLGVANLACAYLSGMPASGSLTRSALNFESGARTPASSLFSGLLCLVGALTLGPLLMYVPKSALAMLVICIAISLVHRRQIRISLMATKSDALVFVFTFIATLLVPLHVAIFSGVGLSVMLYLRKASQPTLVEYAFNQEGHLAEAANQPRQHPSISIVHVEGDLFFGAAELFGTQIQRICADPNLRIIILRLKNARHLDATSVMALEELIRVIREQGRDLIVSGAMKDVYRVLKDSGLVRYIGRENIFMGSASNPNISTRNALKRAQEILGAKEADIHIYYDPRHQKQGSKE
jgi:sulfate permease, SulP family